jgi:hypothetical protein
MHLVLGFLRCLGPVTASRLGGAVARAIGPWLPLSRVADANLRLALPELDATARRRVIRGVWDNLGRTIGELPHIGALQRTTHGPGWEVEGEAIALRMATYPGPIVLIFPTRGRGAWPSYRPENERWDSRPLLRSPCHDRPSRGFICAALRLPRATGACRAARAGTASHHLRGANHTAAIWRSACRHRHTDSTNERLRRALGTRPA